MPVVPWDASVQVALGALRASRSGMVIVARGDSAGVLGEDHVVEWLMTGVSPQETVGEAVTRSGKGLAHLPSVESHATPAAALRRFESLRAPVLMVVDPGGRPIGVVSPSDLVLVPRRSPRPAMAGGMATPFGVYLTTGSVSGGVGPLALMATGAVMFTILFAAQWLTNVLASHLSGQGVSLETVGAVEAWLPLALFLAVMRALPLSGIHAAEHQVVHAIERGEELEPQIVARMPRVHPRCGTNLAVRIVIFLGILSADTIPDLSLRFLVAAMTALIVGPLLGNFIQLAFTTRPASRRQIEMGIASGRDLLRRYAESPRPRSSVFDRIWRSGILHVIAGALAVFALLALLSVWVPIPVPLY